MENTSDKFYLEMEHINKSFSGVQVLKDVHFHAKKGEVHALMGENGAGKSTLMKILNGIFQADSGEIFIDGKKCEIKSVTDAQRYGISIIHQEISLVNSLSIAENIFLGRELLKGCMVDFSTMYKEAKRVLELIGLHISPNTLVRDLSVSQQQQVEIARALHIEGKVLVFDEPTASLTEKEVDHLFDQVQRLKELGIAIIYISHKFDEIFRIADMVTVLRDGEHIHTSPISQITPQELIKYMVGRDLGDYYIEPIRAKSDPFFEVKNLTTDYVQGISFQLNRGEVLGFTGLIGAGRTEVMRALVGIDPILSGEMRLEGKEYRVKNPKEAIAQGVVLAPEDRKKQGLFLSNTVNFNLTIAVLEKIYSFLWRENKKKEKQIIKHYGNVLSIKMADGNTQKAGELSGGNQQKIVLAKWLAAEPKILILDEPTRGIDVGAKSEIYHLIRDITQKGVSVIMVSSELPEVLHMCSRIAVMHEGKIGKIFDRETEEPNQEEIMYYATGGQ